MRLSGSAQEIYCRASDTIFFKMIPEIISKRIIPRSQKGREVVFKRRTPVESRISPRLKDIRSLYDHIRMLDAEGYPKAFIEVNGRRME